MHGNNARGLAGAPSTRRSSAWREVVRLIQSGSDRSCGTQPRKIDNWNADGDFGELIMQISQRRVFGALLPVLLLFTPLSSVSAQTNDLFTNTSLGDWFIASNWDPLVPDANGNAIISKQHPPSSERWIAQDRSLEDRRARFGRSE